MRMKLPPKRIWAYVGGGLMALAIIAIIIVAALADKPTDGMKRYTLNSAGHKYSVMFYSGSNEVGLSDGTTALKHGGDTVVSVKPVNVPLVTDCAGIGEGWSEAIRVNVLGKDTPVCASENGYVAVIQSGAMRHLMTVTFKTKQGDAIKPTLRTIFSSVQVLDGGQGSV